MPFRTWTLGDVPTPAELNDNWRDQVVTQCTSGTRPTTSTIGLRIYETDTKRDYVWVGSWLLVRATDWTTWAPTWTATTTNPILGDGSLTGSFIRNGNQGAFRFILIIGPGSNAGVGTWRFSLPPGWTVPAGQAAGSSLISVGGLFKLAVTAVQTGGYIEVVAEAGLASGTVPATFAASDYVVVHASDVELS
jgi:hypothetical protein